MRKHKAFVPIRLALVEEGELAKDVDQALQDASKSLLHHVRRHDEDKKASAEVTLKIRFSVGDPELGTYEIKSSISQKLPGRPSVITKAMEGQDPGGPDTLFVVRPSGSDGAHPAQKKFSTNDGRPVDPATGQVAQEPGSTKKEE